MTRRTVLGLASAASLYIALLVLTAPLQHSPGEAARLAARRQAALLMDRAEALARRIDPGAGPISIELERLSSGAHPGLCTVVCKDSSGSDLLRSTWRAANGELVAVSRGLVATRETHVISSRAVAVGTAWGWARSLELVQMDGSWRTERVFHGRTDCWGCTYRSGDRRVYVQITAAGAFVMAVASRSTVALARPVVAWRGAGHTGRA